MKKQGSGNSHPSEQKSLAGGPARDQGTVEQLLRQSIPSIGEHAGQSEDLWPAMQRRLRAEAAPEPARVRVPWFDWALAGGLVLLLFAFPAWIPVLLYYL